MTKTQTTHTPGPWMTWAESHGCDIYERKSTGKGKLIAHIPGDDNDNAWIANAHLAAAAPALLDALEETLQTFVDLADWDAETDPHIKRARTVIAQARGQA